MLCVVCISAAKYDADQLRAKVAEIQKRIAPLKKEKKDAEAASLVKEKEVLDKEVEGILAKVEQLEKDLNIALQPIGNIVHASVPVSNDEANNAIVRRWGKKKKRTIQKQKE